MESNWSERDEGINVMSSPKYMLRGGRQIAVSSSTTPPVGNLQIEFQSSESILEEVAAPIPRPEGEVTSHGLIGTRVLEERPISRIFPTQSLSLAKLAKLEDTVREHIASIPILVEEVAVWLFGNAGCATESCLDTKLMFEIRTVVNRWFAKAFLGSAFQTTVRRRVQKCLAEPQSVNHVATRTCDVLVFKVPAARFMKN